MKHVIAITILLLLAAPSWAEDGAVPVYEPVVISSPGRYVVTRAFGGANPIQVAADDVDIDLHGFTLTSTSGAVVAIADGVTDVSIHDGHLTGGSDGIVHLATSVASRLRVRNVDIDATGYGIRVATLATRVSIAGCSIVAVSEEGVHLETTLAASTFSVTDTRLMSVAKSGIAVSGFSAGEISHCHVEWYGDSVTNGAGILLDGSAGALVYSNTVGLAPSGDDDGIRVSYASRVTRNSVTSVGRDGIRADVVDVINENIVGDAGSVGITGGGPYVDVLENSVRQSSSSCDIDGAAVVRANNLWSGAPSSRICNFSYDTGDNAQ